VRILASDETHRPDWEKAAIFEITDHRGRIVVDLTPQFVVDTRPGIAALLNLGVQKIGTDPGLYTIRLQIKTGPDRMIESEPREFTVAP